jgi:hypothetical protein
MGWFTEAILEGSLWASGEAAEFVANHIPPIGRRPRLIASVRVVVFVLLFLSFLGLLLVALVLLLPLLLDLLHVPGAP